MAFRLAMEAPDEIAAIAAVAANLPTRMPRPARNRVTRRVSCSGNGTEDPINPYQGGVVSIFGFAARGTVLSRGFGLGSAERNGITASPVTTRMPRGQPDDPTSVENLTWSTQGKPISRLYTVHGGGHVIPQKFRFRRLLGRTTTALNAPSEAMRFFET